MEPERRLRVAAVPVVNLHRAACFDSEARARGFSILLRCDLRLVIHAAAMPDRNVMPDQASNPAGPGERTDDLRYPSPRYRK
jgi:hypothetical protein